MMTFMTSDIMREFKQVPYKDRGNAEKLLDFLDKLMGSEGEELDYKETYLTASQGRNETFKAYLTRIQKARLDGYPEEDQDHREIRTKVVERFVDGLTNRELSRHLTNNMESYFNGRDDNLWDRVVEVTTAVAKRMLRKEDKHAKAVCMGESDEEEDMKLCAIDMEGVVCFACRGFGHYARDCTNGNITKQKAADQQPRENVHDALKAFKETVMGRMTSLGALIEATRLEDNETTENVKILQGKALLEAQRRAAAAAQPVPR
jgi:hypothetical protein